MSSPSFLSQFIIAYSHWFLTTWQSWFESPQILVERLATAVVALQLLQFVLYHARFGSTSSSSVRRRCAWAAFYLPVPLAAMAVAVMLRLRWCPYWVVAVFFAAGQADTVAAYSLRDADRLSVRRFAKRALSLAYLALAAFVHGDDGAIISNLRRKEIFSLVLGFLVVLQDLNISRKAMASPSEICKFATDHVRFHRPMPTPTLADDDEEPSSQLQLPQARPSVVTVGSLESYRSAVSGCTTLEDIRTSGSRLSSRLDDACLSSALFLQLLQRYNDRPQQVNKLECSSANHAFRDVLAEARGWKGALRLVDAQLSLMKDFFFSVHGSPSGTSYRLYVPYSLLKIGFMVTVRSLAMEEKPAGRFTSATLYALIMLELCQLFGYLMSDRFLVPYMCGRKEDLHLLGGMAVTAAPGEFDFSLSSIMEELGWNAGCLGQYSLVEEFDRASSLKQRFMGILQLGLARRRRRLQTQRGTSRKTPSSFRRSLQFQELKRWIICDKAPGSERHRFAFDVESMWVCESLADALSWTLIQETRIHTILIWHVATWFCDMSPAEDDDDDASLLVVERIFPAEHTFATMLSSYCAYLVAHRPELLPEHHALTASILDKAVEEAALIFGAAQTTPPDERYTVLKSLLGQRLIAFLLPRQGIFKQGMKLGHQLMTSCGSSERWEIMADFWAEMTLLLAQSGDAAAHVERLPADGGGEFVTQLWVLLSNGWDRSFIRRNSSDGGRDTSWGAMLRAVCLAIGEIVEQLQ